MTLQPVEVIFPDAELWATGVIRAALAARSEPYVTGVKVSNTVPPTMPARQITIRRDGGSKVGVFDNPRFGVNIWAATDKDAADLARLVSALFRLTPGDGVCVFMQQTAGPVTIPDAKPRRYMTFVARLRGEAL